MQDVPSLNELVSVSSLDVHAVSPTLRPRTALSLSDVSLFITIYPGLKITMPSDGRKRVVASCLPCYKKKQKVRHSIRGQNCRRIHTGPWHRSLSCSAIAAFHAITALTAGGLRTVFTPQERHQCQTTTNLPNLPPMRKILAIVTSLRKLRYLGERSLVLKAIVASTHLLDFTVTSRTASLASRILYTW